MEIVSQAREPVIHEGCPGYCIRIGPPLDTQRKMPAVRAMLVCLTGLVLCRPSRFDGLVIDGSDLRIRAGSSQYPIFKVQAQRGDTLPARPPAVNRFLKLPCGSCPGNRNAPGLPEASHRRRAPRIRGGTSPYATGSVRSRAVKMAPSRRHACRAALGRIHRSHFARKA